MLDALAESSPGMKDVADGNLGINYCTLVMAGDDIANRRASKCHSVRGTNVMAVWPLDHRQEKAASLRSMTTRLPQCHRRRE